MDIKRNFINLADPAIFQTFGGEKYWERVDLPAGSKMVSEGEDTTDFYYILSGTLMVSKTMGKAGVEKELARLGEGDFFGEGSLLSERVRTATVTALTDCSCYKLPAKTFAQVVLDDPAVANAILLGVVKGMNDRLFNMNNRLMALYDVSMILSKNLGHPQLMMPAVFSEVGQVLGTSTILFFGMDGIAQYKHPKLGENAVMNLQVNIPNIATRFQNSPATPSYAEGNILYLAVRDDHGFLVGILAAEVSERHITEDSRLLMSVAEQVGHVLGQ